MTAIYAGSFDPPTNGHVDMIARAAALFERVVVAVGYNQDKSAWLPVETRVNLLERIATETLQTPNVTVCSFSGLVVDCARQQGANVIIKGLRNEADFASEWTQATVNRQISGMETLWLPSLPEWQPISASVVRELSHFGGPTSQYVPSQVQETIAKMNGQPASGLPADGGQS